MRRRKYIQTVCGPIPPEDLGFCLPHEHIFIRKGYPHSLEPRLWMDDQVNSESDLLSYRASGGHSVVDCLPGGCGRMACALLQASRRTGVNIIGCTGFYKLDFYPPSHWLLQWDADRLTRFFLEELRIGMYGRADDCEPRDQTTARAGFVKSACGAEGITPAYERMLRISAQAVREADIPIMCHTEKGVAAMELIELFLWEGVLPERIILCHLDRRLGNLPLMREAASAGVWLELDTISRPQYHTDEAEARLLLQLLEQGLGSKVLISLDALRDRRAAYGGEGGLTYMQRIFLPKLSALGASREEINMLTVDNPARAFSLG